MNPNPLIENSVLGSQYLNPQYLFNQGLVFLNWLWNFLNTSGDTIIAIYHILLFFFALFFLLIIAYASVRVLEIRKKEHKHLQHEIAEYAHRRKEREKKMQESGEVSKNSRWIKTLNYLFSQHASDWKLAVIEADTMLEGLLDQLGFIGETLGDKLKSATQEKFKSLTSAWEVHTIRNRIAHEGAAYELSQHEAKRVIAIYEQIFRDYGFI